MLETLERFEADGHIDPIEAEVGIEAHLSGTEDHTIGYEVELLPSAGKETPRVAEDDFNGVGLYDAALVALEPYRYDAGPDGIYELASPPSRHPFALDIATRGLVSMGWLPESPKGTVTSHVSIGHFKPEPDLEETDRLINMLRAVELAGGTTPGRLQAPIKMAELRGENTRSCGYSWNQKGLAGVDKNAVTSCLWEGDSRRIEFRTLRYQSLQQFGKTLTNLYFLSRGLLAPAGTAESSIYTDFEVWFEEYRDRHGLMDIEDVPQQPNAHILTGDMKAYLMPYVKSLGVGVDEEFHGKVSQTVESLAEEFGMEHCSPDSESKSAKSTI